MNSIAFVRAGIRVTPTRVKTNSTVSSAETCVTSFIPLTRPPPLPRFEATVRVSGPGGARLVPIARFHVPPGENVQKETILKPNEIVTEILLPPPAKGLRTSYRKVRARRSWDFALASVALGLQFDGDKIAKARVVFGGAAPVPWRSKEAEEVITGKRLDTETVTRAAAAAVKNAKSLKHNGYKIYLFRGMIEEELAAIARV